MMLAWNIHLAYMDKMRESKGEIFGRTHRVDLYISDCVVYELKSREVAKWIE